MRVRASTIATPLLLPLAPLLAAPLLSGCSNVPNRRVALLPEIQTVASVGGKTTAVVAGVPGESARSAPAPERRPREAGKVAGRVVDADGRPVANAEVRVAVDGTPGGRIAQATTDEAGGFTLAGLRPGASYRLVAEYDDGRGRLAGRAEVEAPDRAVQIRLAADDDGDAPARPARVSRTSGRVEDVDDEPAEAEGGADADARRDPLPKSAERVNEADIVPGGDIADLGADPEPAPRASKPKAPRVRVSSRPKGMGWQRGDAGATEARTDDAVARPAPAVASRPEPEPAAAATATSATADLEDDGPNPLPPAREPAKARQRDPEPAPVVEPKPTRPIAPPDAKAPAGDLQPAPPASTLAADPEATTTTTTTTDPVPAPAPAPTAESTPSPVPLPTPTTTPDPAPLPEARGAEPPPATNPDPAPVEMVPVPAPTEAKPAEAQPEPAASPAAEPTQASTPPPEAARRTTWGDLPSLSDLNNGPVDPPPPARLALASHTNRPRAPARDAALVRAECRYDPVHQRLTDFQLPGLAGRPVRFRDLDADLVLIDFWGTWCGPCLDAIPHLVELQRRLGGNRLRVVGVAYEEGPAADRVAAVEAARRRLGINYTLVLGGVDGPCPLQGALKVTAYPTLVLFDRQGHLLWRSQGNDPRTLSRLDRVIAAHANDDTIRR